MEFGGRARKRREAERRDFMEAETVLFLAFWDPFGEFKTAIARNFLFGWAA